MERRKNPVGAVFKNKREGTTWVAGVDGCRAGWVVVLAHAKRGQVSCPRVHLCPSFREVLTIVPKPMTIALDIPVGLLNRRQRGGRLCDREARQLLRNRPSSVFSPPTRSLLQASCYEEVRRKGLTIQAFNILQKIREVDAFMTPQLQKHVFEAHPELAFMSMTGHSMLCNKKMRQGQRERVHALNTCPWKGWEALVDCLRDHLHAFPRREVSPDDWLDAGALVHTALKRISGTGRRVPTVPPLDARRLRMEIWY